MKQLYKIIIYSLILATSVTACDSMEKGTGNKSGKKDGVVKQHRGDGSLKNEISYKNGKRNGIAKTYYKNGVLRQQVNYVNNVKHGEVTTYYETGKKYQVTPYENGKINGIRKKYRMDGRLLAEVPYVKDEPCAGLKEYLLNGEPKTQYPDIIITEIDNLLKANEFILRLSISDNSKKVVYYLGELDKNGCIKDDAMKVMAQKPGVLDLKYSLGPGMFMMETINIIAVVETRLGNPYVTQKKYNLAIENRG